MGWNSRSIKRLYWFVIPIVFSIILGTTVMVYADDFARPDSDPSVRWVNGIGSPPCDDLTTFDCVDETIRDDSDYIQTIALGNGGQDIQLYTLSDIPTPSPTDQHTLRYTLREGNEGANPVGFTIELRQGSTSIATFTHAQGSLPTTFTLFQQNLTPSEISLITDYTQLELTLTGTCESGCANQPAQRERVAVSWIELAIITSTPPPTLDGISVPSTTSLELFWTEPLDTSSITGYIIQRDDGSGFNQIDTVVVGTTTYLNSGLTPNTTYTYRLISISPNGNSIPSNEISQTTTIVITPPDYARPDSSDDLRWVGGVGCPAVDNYQCVDEEVRDDSDYIHTVALGRNAQDSEFLTLSDIEDPVIPVTHVLRYTLAKENQGSNEPAFEMQLRQGGGLIATWTHPSGTIPATLTLYERILTDTQRDSITDYNGLELTMIATCDSSCANQQSSRESLMSTWVEFEILFPVVNIQAEQLYGLASIIEWEVPVVEDNIEKYVIKRSEDAGAFTNIIETLPDSNNKVINTETGREVFHELDSTVVKGSSYIYQVYSVKNSKETIEPSTTTSIQIPARESGHTFVSTANLLNTNRVLIPQPTPVIGFDWYGLLQEAQAVENPIFTTTLNPKNESYLLALTPIPSPQTNDCEQKMDIHFKRDVDSGQDFTVIVTILANQTTVTNQFTFDQISDSTKRIFNRMQDIPVSEQMISDFTNLEIQIDIDTTDDINPLNHRKLSIYEVNFIVPESNPAC